MTKLTKDDRRLLMYIAAQNEQFDSQLKMLSTSSTILEIIMMAACFAVGAIVGSFL